MGTDREPSIYTNLLPILIDNRFAFSGLLSGLELQEIFAHVMTITVITPPQILPRLEYGSASPTLTTIRLLIVIMLFTLTFH